MDRDRSECVPEVEESQIGIWARRGLELLMRLTVQRRRKKRRSWHAQLDFERSVLAN